jgi:hypothetical protein
VSWCQEKTFLFFEKLSNRKTEEITKSRLGGAKTFVLTTIVLKLLLGLP